MTFVVFGALRVKDGMGSHDSLLINKFKTRCLSKNLRK